MPKELPEKYNGSVGESVIWEKGESTSNVPERKKNVKEQRTDVASQRMSKKETESTVPTYAGVLKRSIARTTVKGKEEKDSKRVVVRTVKGKEGKDSKVGGPMASHLLKNPIVR